MNVEQMNRYRFLDVFEERSDGSLSPKAPLEVNGVSFEKGVPFGPGLTLSGINFHNHRYRDIAAEQLGGRLVIRGFYKNGRGTY